MLHIIIENGDVFEGTIEQFEEYIGGGPVYADKEFIERICAQEGWSVKFLESPIGKTIKSIKLGTHRDMTLYFTDGTSIGVTGERVCSGDIIMKLVERK